MSQYGTHISGGNAQSSVFAEVEIQIHYNGWFKFWDLCFTITSTTVEYQPSHRIMQKSSQTDKQFCNKSISNVDITGLFRAQIKYLEIFHTSSKRNSFSLACSSDQPLVGRKVEMNFKMWLFIWLTSISTTQKVYNSRQQNSQLTKVCDAVINAENQSSSNTSYFLAYVLKVFLFMKRYSIREHLQWEKLYFSTHQFKAWK